MKIVVTGASGNAGTALRRHPDLTDAGLDVRAPSSPRNTTRAHQDLKWWPEHDARDVLREVMTAMGGRA
ncbi:NAD(P)-dependent oxidoreductase [Lentzea cavernae]|uniref:NAD(P)-dependent oxidoreductase n=1 Tax=Lentzea cavernae TaxID=2020703 RepID=UPI001748863A|nr:NAD(P)-dependent oxidoreductase [Lentzea cavernae]